MRSPAVRPIVLPVLALAVIVGLAGVLAGQGTPPSSPLTLLSREGRRPLPSVIVDGQEMVALDDLAAIFRFTVREDTLAGAVLVSYKDKTIVLTPEQALASVAGRLVSLAAPLTKSGRRWLVPVEFVSRALAPIYDVPLELRKMSRLVIVGDIRVPRVSVRYETAGATLRAVFDVVPPTPASVVRDAQRLLVRFEADTLDVSLPAPPAQPLVTSVHVVDPGNVIALEGGARFTSFRASTVATDAASTRLVIDVLPAEAETAPALPAAPEPPPLIGPSTSAIRTIVIDPGHGGQEEGARGPGGSLEKDVTLSVGGRLKAAIESRLGIRVLMTREDDRDIELDARAAIANNNKADLFVSLHANASVRRTAKGAEVFYLSLDKYGDEARRQAASDAQLLPVFGGGSREIDVILWDMAQVRYIEQSARLAAMVEAGLRGRVEMSARAVQQAPFRVLVGANMPAVLVEMGYITNPDQEQQLASAAFQNAVVQSVVDAVLRFREYLEQGRPAAPASANQPPSGTLPGR